MAILLYIVATAGIIIATGVNIPGISWYLTFSAVTWLLLTALFLAAGIVFYRFTAQRYEFSDRGIAAKTIFLDNSIDLLSYFMPWGNMAKAVFYPDDRAIYLRNNFGSVPFSLWIYCAPDNYTRVQETITRMATRARRRWKAPGLA